MEKKLNKAFRALKKLGYFTQRNKGMSQTLAGATIPDSADKYVFYSKQDLYHYKEYGTLYLGWKGDGQEIVNTVKDAGLTVQWEGSVFYRIFITD